MGETGAEWSARVSLKRIATLSKNRRMIRTEGIRQSDRVTVQLQVEATWFGSGGVTVRQAAQTLLVSRNGGVVRLSEKLFPGQELTLVRKLEGDQIKRARARIMAEIDQEPEGFIYAIAMLEPQADFWDIEFPSVHKSEEALARLLMECSFCQRREVAYLNEMEVKSFEIRRCVARVCKTLRCAVNLDRGAFGCEERKWKQGRGRTMTSV